MEMDATNMTFEDNSFDVVVDKGTLDAVICGKDTQIISKLIQEMTRVVKPQGQVFIISHGTPESRKSIVEKSVDSTNFEFNHKRRDLSDSSQLINIFRTKLKDKPLSHILKDKELLMQSMQEYKKFNFQKRFMKAVELKRKMKLEQEQEDLEEKERLQKEQGANEELDKEKGQETDEKSQNKQIDFNNDQNYVHKIINSQANAEDNKTIQLNTFEVQENQIPLQNTQSQSMNSQDELLKTEKVSVDVKKEEHAEIKDTANNNMDKVNSNPPSNENKVLETIPPEKEEENKTADDSSSAKKNNFQYNPQRQSFCYVYNIRKLH